MAEIKDRSRDEVVRSIVSLLVTEKPPYHIPIPRLESIYRNAEDERIPYRDLGYPSIVEFLRSIPQIELITRDGTNLINFLGSEKSRGVSELVAKQRSNPKNNRSRSTCRRGIPPGYFLRSHSAFSSRCNDISRCNDSISRNNDSISRNNENSFRNNESSSRIFENSSRLSSEVLEILHRSSNGLSKTTLLHKIREKRLGFIDMQSLNDILNNLGGKILVQDNVVYLSRTESRDISWDRSEPVKQKPVTIKNDHVETRGDMDFFEDDFGLESMGNIPHESGPSGNSRKIGREVPQMSELPEVQGISNGNSRAIPAVDDPRTQAEVDLVIGSRMRFRLEKLIQNRPQGIWCAELPKVYKEEYNLDLAWQELGFNSLSDLVLHLPDVFRCVQPSPADDFRLFDAKNEDEGILPVRSTLSSIHKIYMDPEDDVKAIPTGLSPHQINKLIPEDVMLLGETVGQVLIDCFNQEDKGYEEVVVCDAFTPSFFWIHLRRKVLKLEAMMEAIQEFYTAAGNNYSVPLIVLEKGLNVVCKFYGKWHRGIVKGVDPDAESTTTVLFYDYGTLHTYPASAMHFLHRKFSQLPAQAIPCGLYNVKPPENSAAVGSDGKTRWSIHTSRRFVQRVHDKPLVAICGKKFHENNSMLLSLTDTSSEEDVNIAEWLVENGLAVHGSMVRIRPKNFPYKYILTCKPKTQSKLPIVKPLPPCDVSKLLNKTTRVASKIESLRAKLLDIGKVERKSKSLPKCPTCGQWIKGNSGEGREEVDVGQVNGTEFDREVIDEVPRLDSFRVKSIRHWVETGFLIAKDSFACDSYSAWDEVFIQDGEAKGEGQVEAKVGAGAGIVAEAVTEAAAEAEVEAEAKAEAQITITAAEAEDKITAAAAGAVAVTGVEAEAETKIGFDERMKNEPELTRTPLHLMPPTSLSPEDAVSEYDVVLKPKRQCLGTGVIDWDTLNITDKNPAPKPVDKLEILKSIPKPKRKIIETDERLAYDGESIGRHSPLEEDEDDNYEMIQQTIKQALKNNRKPLKASRVVVRGWFFAEGSNRKAPDVSMTSENSSGPQENSGTDEACEFDDEKDKTLGEEEEKELEVAVGENLEVEKEEPRKNDFSPPLDSIVSSIPRENSGILIEEIVSKNEELNNGVETGIQDDSDEATPRVLIETSSSGSGDVEMVSVYPEFLKKSPHFRQQILEAKGCDESLELDSDDETSGVSADEEHEEDEEVEAVVKTEIISSGSISKLNDDLKINYEKSGITNGNVPGDIPVFDDVDLEFDDEEFDVYLADDDVFMKFQKQLMNHDNNENMKKMIDSSELPDDVEEVFRTPEDSEESIVSVSTL